MRMNMSYRTETYLYACIYHGIIWYIDNMLNYILSSFEMKIKK